MQAVDEEILKKQCIFFYLKVWGGTINFKGNCMFPVLKDGFRIKIEPIDSEKIDIGDIIVFNDIDKLVVHRVIGKIKKGNYFSFVEKGDNNHFIRIRLAEEVVGRVVVADGYWVKDSVALWRKNNFFIINWYFACSVLYAVLSQIKRKIFKNKINSVVKNFHNCYWKTCFLISEAFFKNTNCYGS